MHLDSATLWWIMAGITVAAELLIGSFYLLMIALGLAAGGLAAWLGFGDTAQVTIAFVSQLISVVRDAEGNVVDGSADSVSEVNDVWTFSRQLGSRDPNWLLVATESAA